MNATFTIGPVTNNPDGTTDVSLNLTDPGDFNQGHPTGSILLRGLSTAQVGMLTPGLLFTVTFTGGAYSAQGG